MKNSTSVKAIKGQPAPRRGFSREKEEHLEVKPYLDFLAHYDAELVRINGTIVVVRYKTGTELPLEQKGKLQMLKQLLDEFATVDGVNAAIGNYKASRS